MLAGARARRSVLLGGAGAIMAAAGCGSPPAALYGACPPDSVDIFAACGIQSISSTCTGATPTCSGGNCSVGPITSACTISVVLGDGTTHTISAAVAEGLAFCAKGQLSATPESVNLTSASCAGPTLDGGTDAPAEVSVDGHD